jgi:hypothetical protein
MIAETVSRIQDPEVREAQIKHYIEIFLDSNPRFSTARFREYVEELTARQQKVA